MLRSNKGVKLPGGIGYIHSFEGIMKCLDNNLIIFSQNGAGVEKQRIAFDPGNYRWLLISQSYGQLLCYIFIALQFFGHIIVLIWIKKNAMAISIIKLIKIQAIPAFHGLSEPTKPIIPIALWYGLCIK